MEIRKNFVVPSQRRQQWRNWYRTGIAPVESLTDGGKSVSPAKPISGGVETWSEITPLSLCIVPKLTWNWPKFNWNHIETVLVKMEPIFSMLPEGPRVHDTYFGGQFPISKILQKNCWSAALGSIASLRITAGVYPKIWWRFIHPLLLRNIFYAGRVATSGVENTSVFLVEKIFRSVLRYRNKIQKINPRSG